MCRSAHKGFKKSASAVQTVFVLIMATGRMFSMQWVLTLTSRFSRRINASLAHNLMPG